MIPLIYKHDAVAFARELLAFEPDAAQAEILSTTSNRVILNCRRQWGKSSIAAIRAVHRAATQPNQTIVLISTTMRQSRELARKCLTFARKLDVVLTTDGTNARSIVFPNGSIILPLPAHPDYVRGFTADMVIMDEASRVKDEVFAAATPMLATTGGDFWMLSTPNGRQGMFYEVWSGTDRADDRWLRIEGKASDRTGAKVSPNFFAVERRQKTSEAFDAEHECQFTSTDRSVFSMEALERAFCEGIPVFDELVRSSLEFVKHRPVYYIGLDLAGIGDYAALVIVEYKVTPTGTRDPATYQFLYRRQLRVVHIERFRKGTPYAEIVRRVAKICRHPHLEGHTQLVVEHNGPGVPVVQMLRDEKLPVSVVALTTTGGQQATVNGSLRTVPKKEIVSVLEILFEKGILKIAADLPQADLLREELRQFERRSSRGGQVKYGAASGHDDLVMSLGFACWWAWSNRRHLLQGPELVAMD